MEEGSEKTIIDKMFEKGAIVFFFTVVCTFVLNKFLSAIWLSYAPIVLAGIYFVWTFVSIYNGKFKSIFSLNKRELLFYQVIVPSTLTVLVAVICGNMKGEPNGKFEDNIIKWILKNQNISLLIVVFAGFVVVCYFLAFERSKICEETKNGCHFPTQSVEWQQKNQEQLNNISQEVEKLKSILEKRSPVGYTATCIPVRYNEEHDTLVFALIKNMSHKECQWMFPGSHVEVSNNQLREEFNLTDISIVPGKIIQEKVKKEAGLYDLQFIDPYYDVVSREDTEDGIERRSYPNTCYPAKAPVFNYLFRVSKSAKCYVEQNHRCHYDFTYVGEYGEIKEEEAEYDIVEVELKRNKIFKDMERSEAIAYINACLGKQINKKLKTKGKKKQEFTISYDKLCLDSISEMIYNAALFYIDYKDLKK